MTENMPTSEPDAPASTTGPSQPLAAELLATAELPATTAAPAALSPKLPRCVGD